MFEWLFIALLDLLNSFVMVIRSVVLFIVGGLDDA